MLERHSEWFMITTGPDEAAERSVSNDGGVRKLSKPGIGLGFFDPEAFAEYVRCFTWKTIRGSCEDYRACVTCDLEMDEAD